MLLCVHFALIRVQSTWAPVDGLWWVVFAILIDRFARKRANLTSFTIQNSLIIESIMENTVSSCLELVVVVLAATSIRVHTNCVCP